MFSYKIIKDPTFPIEKKSIDQIFKNISNIVEKKQNWVLNIVFLDSLSIKNLNKNYRKIDKVTDVLSFHYFENFENIESDEIAWEIVMCEEKILLQAKEFWLWEEKEFYKLLIHSVLHILWYDHEKDNDYKLMFELEKAIWQEVFEK
jgi:probable rRNA maturation factor